MKKKTLVCFATVFAVLLASMIMPFAVGAAENVPDPIAWYDFEDEENFGKDKMGNYDLTCENGNNMPSSKTGAVGNGIYVDGEYCLALPIDNDFSKTLKTFTVSYYAIRELRTLEQFSWQTPVSMGSMRFMHRIDGADKDLLHIICDSRDWWSPMIEYTQYCFTSFMDMYTISVDVANGKTNMKFYLNGDFINETVLDYEATIAKDGFTFSVGAQANADAWFYSGIEHAFVGVIDEVRVWDTVLTADQVAAVFNSDCPNGAKTVDEIFPLDLPDDDDTTDTDTDTDTDGVTTDALSADDSASNSPAVTTGSTSGDDNDGISPVVIVVIAVAVVLVIAVAVLAVVSKKKKKS